MTGKRAVNRSRSSMGGSQASQMAHWRRIELHQEMTALEQNLCEVWDETPDPETTLSVLGDHPERYFSDSAENTGMAFEAEPDDVGLQNQVGD